MADTPVPAPTPAAASDAISVEELASIISTMNRFLAKFAGSQTFTDSKITVADWMVMMILLKMNESRCPQIAMLLGIAEQRITRIAASLADAGLILSVASDDPGRPHPTLSLTDAGKTRLAALDNVLLPLLKNALANNPNGLIDLKRNLVSFIRIIPA